MACVENPNGGSGISVERARLSRRVLLRNVGIAVAATGASAMADFSPAQAETAPTIGYGAPLAEIQVPAGLLTSEQKSDMIKGVTDVIVNALKLPPAQHRALWVLIVETAPGGFGVAGQPIGVASQRPPEPATKP
jgi:4-oxalocrotonate tautomerase family enzyme